MPVKALSSVMLSKDGWHRWIVAHRGTGCSLGHWFESVADARAAVRVIDRRYNVDEIGLRIARNKDVSSERAAIYALQRDLGGVRGDYSAGIDVIERWARGEPLVTDQKKEQRT